MNDKTTDKTCCGPGYASPAAAIALSGSEFFGANLPSLRAFSA